MLVLDPVGAVLLGELVGKDLVDPAQVDDIAARIAQLLLRQRTASPVGELGRLVDRTLEHAAHEVLVTDGIAKPARHGGNLRVEDRTGRVAH